MSPSAKKAFVDRIRPHLASLGFRKVGKDHRFEYRADGLGHVSIAVDLVRTSERGVFKIAISLHMRLGPEEAVLAEVGDDSEFLLNINFDNWWSDTRTGSRLETTINDLDAGAELAADLIRDELLPFVDRNARGTVLENLRQASPRDRITSDVNARYRLLLAAAAIADDREDFETLGSDFLVHCRRFLPHLLEPAEQVIQSLRDRHWPETD